MSSRYAFTQTVKELRFLFCQTSEHSAAVRLVCPRSGEPLPPEQWVLAGHSHPRVPLELGGGPRMCS